jgi:hypothetical protein
MFSNKGGDNVSDYADDRRVIRESQERGNLLCPCCKADTLTFEDMGDEVPDWFLLCPKCKRAFCFSIGEDEVDLEVYEPSEVTPSMREYLKAKGLLRKEYEK